MLEQALSPQAGEHRLCDESPVAGTELRVVAKEGAQQGVRRSVERQHRSEGGCRPGELRRFEISHGRVE
jgi:hypothetical protein